ncbi:two-component system regulatory protein YycI [Fusibacter tunisiensis]|uniref:Regulatory protein YycH-like domain-containing protein n=1 Tax=Fusibacter tunisiensis TaxID=1008308 RepID=A0ABS2MPB9_9FIRM|nr:hypothetical protein [Fusibacter tunisiensis]MBM7561246.1 hypothetical protein [Fusibacter tunisiensis]
MDWPKIKNIIIGLLVITNLMLGFIIMEDLILFNSMRTSNIRDVMTLYHQNGIDSSVDLEELRFPLSVSSVELEFIPIPEQTIQLFLGPGYVAESNRFLNENSVVYHNRMTFVWALTAHEGRVLQDKGQNLRWFKTLSEAESQALILLAEEFFTQKSVEVEYDLVSARQLGDYSLVELVQTVNGLILEENRTLIWLYQDEVVGYKLSWPVTVHGTDVAKYDIIQLDAALYSALSYLSEGDSIEDISLVYKLNDSRFQVSNLISGEALPYYRIQTVKGEIVYIQAVETP